MQRRDTGAFIQGFLRCAQDDGVVRLIVEDDGLALLPYVSESSMGHAAIVRFEELIAL